MPAYLTIAFDTVPALAHKSSQVKSKESARSPGRVIQHRDETGSESRPVVALVSAMETDEDRPATPEICKPRPRSTWQQRE